MYYSAGGYISTLILCSSCCAYLMMAIVSSSLRTDSSKKASIVCWSQFIWFLKSCSFCLVLKIWFCIFDTVIHFLLQCYKRPDRWRVNVMCLTSNISLLSAKPRSSVFIFEVSWASRPASLSAKTVRCFSISSSLCIALNKACEHSQTKGFSLCFNLIVL